MNTLLVNNRRRPLLVSLGCALSLLLGACGSDASNSPTSDTLASPSTTSTPTTLAATTVAPIPTSPATQPPPPPPTTTTSPPTTVAPTTTIPETTTTLPAGAALVLRNDGIGDARFGTDPDEVIAYISGVVGAPVQDSGWVDAISRTCRGTEVRFVTWGDLTLAFGDDSDVSSGRRHFVSWSFGPAAEPLAAPAGMATAEGISIGSSVVDIGRAYPTASLFEGDELSTASAQIADGLFAFLTGTSDSGVVTAMLGGQGCGE